MKKISFTSEQVIKNIPLIDDWLDNDFIKNNLNNWNESISNLHSSEKTKIIIQKF